MLDRDAFDSVVAALDGSMVVVTVSGAGEPSGCLVGFHTQSSIDPPRYVVWISKTNHTHGVALVSTHVAVHALGADDLELARHFGTLSGDDVDKFAGIAWTPGPGGVPLLDDAPNRIVLERTALIDEGGDHICLIGAPVDATATDPHEPLRLGDVRHLSPGHEASADL